VLCTRRALQEAFLLAVSNDRSAAGLIRTWCSAKVDSSIRISIQSGLFASPGRVVSPSCSFWPVQYRRFPEHHMTTDLGSG
jgi:hypothetical protein